MNIENATFIFYGKRLDIYVHFNTQFLKILIR